MVKFLTGFLLLAIAHPAPVFAAFTEQYCGCRERLEIKAAKIAFKGKITGFTETKAEQQGFAYAIIDVTFAVDESWSGLPAPTRIYTIRTDSTSCGYGRILAPRGAENLIGGSFGIFTDGAERLDFCNSVIVDESWFGKNFNPFTTGIYDNNSAKRVILNNK